MLWPDLKLAVSATLRDLPLERSPCRAGRKTSVLSQTSDSSFVVHRDGRSVRCCHHSLAPHVSCPWGTVVRADRRRREAKTSKSYVAVVTNAAPSGRQLVCRIGA